MLSTSAREIDPTPNEERTLAIERFEPGAVDYAELTALIHRAYARLLADGFEYLAAVQSVEMTQLRVEAGTTFIARVNGRVIGTISYYPGTPHTRPYPEWYEREDVGFFGQFAVIPEMCGQGIGDRLLQPRRTARARDRERRTGVRHGEGRRETRSGRRRPRIRAVGLLPVAPRSLRQRCAEQVLATTH